MSPFAFRTRPSKPWSMNRPNQRVAASVALSIVAGMAHPAEPVDVIFHAGTVITVDARNSLESAVAIRGDRIVAVGGENLLKRYSASTVIDLKGRTLMPGFMDTHWHTQGVTRRGFDARDLRSIAEIKDNIRKKAAEFGPGSWIIGYAWDESLLAERRLITLAELDEAAPNNPVFMVRDGGHSGVGNSLAFEKMKITKDSPNPPGGVFEHDERGELNGYIRERTDLVTDTMGFASFEDCADVYHTMLKEAPRVGLTSVILAGAVIDEKAPFFGAPGACKARWPEVQRLYAERGTEYPRAAVQIIYPGPGRLEKFPHKTGFGDNRLRLSAIGEGPAVDGGISGPTLCTFDDFKTQPGFRGSCFFEQAKLDTLAEDVARNGWQLGLHMEGDHGITMGVEAYTKALDKYPGTGDRRWFTSHFTMLPPEQTLSKMVSHGIYAAAQPNFLWQDSERFQQVLQGRALAHVSPIAVPLKYGVRMAFGADYPLNTHPRYGLYAAVARIGKDGYQYSMDEAVSVVEAIRLYTAAPPFLTWEEKEKGTLEAGKLADMIVVDRNPLTVQREDLLKMNVDLTMIGGKIVYDRAKDGPSIYEARGR